MNKDSLWASGQDETVEVNQRALIDKILARYSGEHTVFRELLQNADDAGANHVQIKFYTQRGVERMESKGKSSGDSLVEESKGGLPDIKKDAIHRYVITNDGIPFRPEDWNRLKKIAEGNPDESKIGAFGVGFYSLWSLADDPFVESGNKWMGFYWKDGKDQLMARSGDLPPSASTPGHVSTLSGNPWTSFTMNMRDPSVLEGPLDLARFLVTSLSFTRSIKQVDMVVDDIPVLEVSKTVKGKERVGVKGMRETSTGGMMKVKSVDATGMVITAKVTQWLAASGFIPPPLPDPVQAIVKPTKAFASFLTSSFFGRQTPTPAPTPPPPAPARPIAEDDMQVTILHREIQVYQAEIGVSVTAAYARELERATKKAPPKVMPASMVFSRAEEAGTVMDSGSSAVAKDVGGVFAGLCPPLGGEKSAKVFIGQATGQTTGIGGHLAAGFIPTVERESIDLVDKHVAVWNRELLWIAGHISRAIYELEMARLQKEWAATSVTDTDLRTKLSAEALHALRFFTFNVTTPSAAVGQEMESAFYQSVPDNKNLPIISTSGIQPIKDVRMPSAELAKFVPDLPVVTPTTIETAPRSVARLQERGLLRDSTFDDVVNLLGKRALTETEMVAALAWWQAIGQMEQYSDRIRDRLLDACVLVTNDGKIIPLSMIQTIIKPSSSSIPPDMPLPPHTMPYGITKDLKAASAWTIFGWTELTLVQYVTFLVKPPMSNVGTAAPETDLRVSPAFAEQVLTMLGRAWQSMSANHQTAIALELKDVACVPTKAGFKKPGESYFEKNLLFDDLPTLALPKTTTIKGGLEKMLLGIGVRKTVDLQLVFTRLIGGGTWSCQDLMKYLVSVKDTLTKEEKDRLKATAAFPLDTSDGLVDPAGATDVKKPIVRKKPKELYEPTPAMRELGLPVLDWGDGKWRPASDEARMLFELGLRKFPPIDVLLGIAAGPAPRNERALSYLLSNMSSHYTTFDPRQFAQIAYIPAIKPDGTRKMAKSGEVYTGWGCAILGFLVADQSVIGSEAAAKLHIPSDPPMETLVAALIGQTTRDSSKARSVFEYLSTRLGSASPAVLGRLETVPFIPVQMEKTVNLNRPVDVYFEGREGQEMFKSAFTFIDFGEKANTFLRYCGVKSEPSVKDIARLIMREPGSMLERAGSAERYMEQLRLLAANWTYFDTATKTAMKSSRFVLASQRVPIKTTKKTFGGLMSSAAEGEYEREWVLTRAGEVSIIDDITMMQFFGHHIQAAPEEQLLEMFYEHLGARKLSSQVKVEHIPHGLQSYVSAETQALRKHVLERLLIFLADARRMKTDYTADGLAKEGVFTIREARTVEAKWVFSNGREMYPHTEKLYALASRSGKGVILTVSQSAAPDDYDIASALCNVLLKSPKADDALLFHSILTTPLMALKKRGFHVDRILNQQREEKLRLRAEAERDRDKLAAAAAEASAKAADAGPAHAAGAGTGPSPFPALQNGRDSDVSEETSSLMGQAPDREKGNSPGKTRSFLDKLRNRKSSGGLGGMPGMPGGFGALGNGGGLGGGGSGLGSGSDSGSGMAGGAAPGVSTKRPTDMAAIRNTVKRAIDASRPEAATQIDDSRRGASEVSESQNTYCDPQAEANIKLAIRATPESLAIWVPRDERDPQVFLADRLQTCQAFARAIIIPLAKTFEINISVFNVFWDLEGPLIAFNRGGAIFCNARYFAAWHLGDCQAGQTNDAFISWYMSIAHELAHNLESAHNSSHEFYFSSIAEEYLVRFTKLLR